MLNRVVKLTRNTTIAVMAIGATMLMLPSTAEAGVGPQRVAERLERIAYEVNRVSDIRGLHRKDRKIDQLQSRLHKLERITDRHRGRRARRNDAQIDRLQHRLRRMEHRVEARMDHRRDRRRDWRRDERRDRRYDDRRYDRHGWNSRGPAIVRGVFGY